MNKIAEVENGLVPHLVDQTQRVLELYNVQIHRKRLAFSINVALNWLAPDI